MRLRNEVARQSLLAALRRGPEGVAALAKSLNVTTRTVLRWLKESEETICSAGAASRTRYALKKPLRGRLEQHPLYRVDDHGHVEEVGALVPVFPEGVLCSLQQLNWPVDAASMEGWWEGLPYPLYDMQPQGFLGRTFARQQHAALEVSVDPRNWSDEDILYILTRTGWDTSGNLILGEQALRRWQDDVLTPEQSIPEAEHLSAYIDLAQDITAMGVAGRSAAGEFPKFTALRTLTGAQTEHVIVKFSGDIRQGATQRWSDLLVCEHLAMQQINALPGLSAACTRILQGQNRTFLEVERFDRVGRFGRRPLVSLSSMNGHLLGMSSEDWRAPVRRLVQQKFLSLAEEQAVLRLWWFGKLISNSDMHMGNLSLVPGQGVFRLAPGYDMLPMAYAPLPGAEVPMITAQYKLPLPAERSSWLDACAGAIAFWMRAGADERISASFRAICRENVAALDSLRQKV